jgi:hypothetical protein
MRRIGAAHHIHRIDTARLFLDDALIDALGTGTLDADGDPGIFRFEGTSQPLRGIKLERRIKRCLAFLPRRFD